MGISGKVRLRGKSLCKSLEGGKELCISTRLKGGWVSVAQSSWLRVKDGFGELTSWHIKQKLWGKQARKVPRRPGYSRW